MPTPQTIQGIIVAGVLQGAVVGVGWVLIILQGHVHWVMACVTLIGAVVAAITTGAAMTFSERQFAVMEVPQNNSDRSSSFDAIKIERDNGTRGAPSDKSSLRALRSQLQSVSSSCKVESISPGNDQIPLTTSPPFGPHQPPSVTSAGSVEDTAITRPVKGAVLRDVPMRASVDVPDAEVGAQNTNGANLSGGGLLPMYAGSQSNGSQLKSPIGCALGPPLAVQIPELDERKSRLSSSRTVITSTREKSGWFTASTPTGERRVLNDVTALCHKLGETVATGANRADDSSIASSEIADFEGLDGGSLFMADRIGRGAYGSVHKCMHEEGMLCAAKILTLPGLADGSSRKDIEIEKTPEAPLGLRIGAGGVIANVAADSPAEKAGLVNGMAVVTVNDQVTVDFTLPPDRVSFGAQDVEGLTKVRLEVVPDIKAARQHMAAAKSIHEMVQEAVLLGCLVSPYITPLLTCALLPRKMIIVMELATGSLASLLSQISPMPMAAVGRYTVHMLNGLDYLHHNGVMHRDFKTANVLLGTCGTCKLTDFGCSKLLAPSRKSLSTRGTTENSSEEGFGHSAPDPIIGTPLYLAPEAAMGRAGITSDIWALGLVVAELVTGRLPYASEPPKER
eukprot:Hpha_TRINITY_DN15744_c3_g3::TRINITY_DN15744_c3_g3_i1::g.37135::m.37135